MKSSVSVLMSSFLQQQIDKAAITSEITTQVYSTLIKGLYMVYKNQQVRDDHMLYHLKKDATNIT